VGDTVVFLVHTSAPLSVVGSGRLATLTLNDGGVASFDQSRTTTGAFAFDYKIKAGEHTTSLAASQINLNGNVAKDKAGHAVNANLAGVPQDAGPAVNTGGQLFDISAPSSQPIAFNGPGAATLADSQHFVGSVSGFGVKDTLDLRDIVFSSGASPTLGYSGTAAGGTLTVSDGQHLAKIALIGNYLASTFVASYDGHGGTSIVDPPAAASQTLALQDAA
jgi:hypothetical protein